MTEYFKWELQSLLAKINLNCRAGELEIEMTEWTGSEHNRETDCDELEHILKY